MPRWSRELRDANGKWLGRVCGSERYVKCSVAECRAHAPYRCDFPVKGPSRKGRRSGTCDRALCERHRQSVGPDRDYCPPHVAATESEQLPLPTADDVPQGKS